LFVEGERFLERAYYKRDQRVVVEEVPDVKAVRVSADERGVAAANAESFGTSAAETVRSSVTTDLPADGLAPKFGSDSLNS
jgi:hypothetical protein